MRGAHHVLHKLLIILKNVFIGLSRNCSCSYHILQRVFGALASKLMRSNTAYASRGTGRQERHKLRSTSGSSPVVVLPSFYYPPEFAHSVVSQHSGRTHAERSSLQEVESNHVSLSIGTVTSRQQSTSPILKPMIASDVRRYSKKSQIQRTDTDHMIPAGQKNFISDKIDAGDLNWDCQIHPHGTLYFSSEQETWRDQDMETAVVQITVFTDTDVRDESNSNAIASCVRTLLDRAQIAGHLEATLTELTIDLFTTACGEVECKYYFAAPDRRVLFWLDDFEAKHLFGEVKGVTSGHLKYAMEAEYWMHRELYPNDCKITPELYCELQAMILHAYTDTIFSEISLAPFDTDELRRALDIVDYLNGIVNKPDSTTNDQYIWAYARLMRMFTRARFSNFYGEIGARLGTDETVYADDNSLKTRPIVKLFNLILFGSPSSHIRKIDSVWVDQAVNRPRWKTFVNGLTSEWNGLAIYSTVMLAVDISFLAIPAIDQRPWAKIALYISSLWSVSSLVVSALLAQSCGHQDSINRATALMTRMTRSLHGKENLAVIFSLPYALVIWGMIFFFLALSLVIFLSANVTTWCTVGPAWLLVIGFIGWPVWAATGPPIGQSMSSLWIFRKTSH